MKTNPSHNHTRSRGPQPERRTCAGETLWVGCRRVGNGPLAAARRAACALVLLLALLHFGAVAQAQTVTIKPIETSVSSGIATNRWTAVTNDSVLRSVMVANTSASDYWVFIFNSSTTNIADGSSTNVAAFLVPANSPRSTVWYDPPGGEVCRAGITILQSTTYPTITNAAAANAALVLTVKHTKN